MRQRAVNKAKQTRKAALWVPFVIVIAMTSMLGLTINYRAYATKDVEAQEHNQLSEKIQSLTDENLQLQDEINDLKTDPRVIEREAKKLGIPLRR